MLLPHRALGWHLFFLFLKSLLSLVSPLSTFFFPLFLWWVQPQAEEAASGHLTTEVAPVGGMVSPDPLVMETGRPAVAEGTGSLSLLENQVLPLFCHPRPQHFPIGRMAEFFFFFFGFFLKLFKNFYFSLGVFFLLWWNTHNIISTTLKYTVQWHLVQSCYTTITAV